MWPAGGFALIGLLAPLVLGAVQVDRNSIKRTTEAIKMREPYFNEGALTTFVGEVDVPKDKTDLSMEELFRYASGAFNWLIETEKDRAAIETQFGTCILSALWIPEDHKVYFATKAKGQFRLNMIGEPVAQQLGFNPLQRYLWAPVWSSRAVKSNQDAIIKNDVYHAEDTVYFYFERQRSFRNNPVWTPPKNAGDKPTYALTNANNQPEKARDAKYPQGAKVVTWGYYPSSSKKEKNEGFPIEACNPSNKYLGDRQSCQNVADDLGIEWASLQNIPQPQVEANNNMNIGAGSSSNLAGCVSNRPGEDPPPNAGENPPTRKRYEPRQDSCLPPPEAIEPVGVIDVPEPADGDGEDDNEDDGSCEDDSQCPPAMCAGGGPGGGGTPTCKDNKCTCSAAEPPPDNSCESTEDCEDLDCDDGMERECIDGGCQCKGPEPPAPTPPPEMPECWMQNALPDQYTSAFCRCNVGEETKTLPLLTVENPTVDTESCQYTTMPTGTENPVTEVTVTFTAGCNVCAGPGGIQNHDPDWCEPIEGCVPPRPTYALYIADTSVSLGTAFNEDEGVVIGQTLVDKLRDACPDDDDICDTTAFEVADVPLIVDEGVEYMILEANVDDSYYNSTSSRDYMIYGAVSGMVEATRESCEEVTYQDPADMGESGCGEGPIPEKRSPPPPEVYWDEETGERQLRKRIPPSDPDGTVDDMMCTYSTNMCAGPKVITAILGTQADPYLNNLGIRFELKKKETGIDNAIGQFFCEAIVNAVALAAMRYAPKLAGFEGVGAIEDMALEAICGKD